MCYHTFILRDVISYFLARELARDPTGIHRISVYTRQNSAIFLAEHFAHALAYDIVVSPTRNLMNANEAHLDALALADLMDEVYALGKSHTN